MIKGMENKSELNKTLYICPILDSVNPYIYLNLMSCYVFHHIFLQSLRLFWRQHIGLGYHRNKVHLFMKSLHKLYVELAQAETNR